MPSSIFSYIPLDRDEFLKIENLLSIALKAKNVGFTDEEINSIVLKDKEKKLEVINLLDLLNFVRESLGYATNELSDFQLDMELGKVDAYEHIQKYLKLIDEDEKKVEKIEYFTVNDLLHDLWGADTSNLAVATDQIIQ